MAELSRNQQIALLQSTMLVDKFDHKSSTIKVNDYLCLHRGMFMNDIIMEFHMNYMYSILNIEEKEKAYVFSTYFYTKLTKPPVDPINSSLSRSEMRHNNVAKWTKNVDIFQKDFLFIPINKDKHWCLAVICFPYLSGKVDMRDESPVNEPDDDTGRYQLAKIEHINHDYDEADPNVEDLWLFDLCLTKNNQNQEIDYDTCVADLKKKKHTLVKRPCILIFDSLSGGVLRASISATLREWLHEEYCTKHNGEIKDFSVMKSCLVKVPQQPNQTDCGLFVMHYFEMFYSKPIIDYTFPINHLENWFHIDDVVKNGKKRREVHNLIMERIKVRGSTLPENFEFLHLNFNDTDEESDEKKKDEEHTSADNVQESEECMNTDDECMSTDEGDVENENIEGDVENVNIEGDVENENIEEEDENSEGDIENENVEEEEDEDESVEEEDEHFEEDEEYDEDGEYEEDEG